MKKYLKEVKKASHVDIRALDITDRGATSAKALRLRVPAVLKESRRPGWQVHRSTRVRGSGEA